MPQIPRANVSIVNKKSAFSCDTVTACFICEHSSYLLSLTYISLTAWFVYFQKLKKLNINTVPEETFTHSHSQERKRRIRTDNKVHSVAAHPICGDLSQLTHTHIHQTALFPGLPG